MNRREFLQLSLQLGLFATAASVTGRGGLVRAAETGEKTELPPLPYDQKALEPYISARTIEFHYGKHHQAYVNNLNMALDVIRMSEKYGASVVTDDFTHNSRYGSNIIALIVL